MKHRTVCNAIYSILLIAFLWTGSSVQAQTLPGFSQLRTTSFAIKSEQKVGQTSLLAEKNGITEEKFISFVSQVRAEKVAGSSFFLSPALTQHFINSTINTTI